MELLGIVQYSVIFFGYLFLIMLLPGLLFYRYLKGKGLTYRFLFSMVTGNLYIINMILLLGLLGISNRYAVLIIVFGIAIWRYMTTNSVDYPARIRAEKLRLKRLLLGQYGIRLYITEKLATAGAFLRKKLLAALSHFRGHLFEWLLFIGITVFNMWYFSYQVFHYYGYGASDTVVHLQWIELIAEGKLFAAGVYPHGFHCIVYFVYTVFDIDLYVMMRFFGPIQSVFVSVMIYVFAKYLCKTKYVAFVPYLLFSCCYIFNTESMMRFQMTIPQEYAMIFLFPLLIFLSMFMRERKKEKDVKTKPKLPRFRLIKAARAAGFKKSCLSAWRHFKLFMLQKGESPVKHRSSVYLFLAAASFSLTLAVHFYITIAAGLMVLAFAIGYFPRYFHKKYLMRLLCAIMLAVFVAVAPMALGILRGNRLEGSLRWAMSIITVGSAETGKITVSENAGNKEEPTTAAAQTQAAETDEDEKDGESEEKKEEKRPFSDVIKECYERFVPAVIDLPRFKISLLALIFTMLLAVLSLPLFKKDRGLNRDWICYCFYILLLFVLFSASTLGLPELMDKVRARVVCAYCIPILYAYPVDLLFRTLNFPFRRFKVTKRIISTMSLMFCAALMFAIVKFDTVKRLSYSYYLQHNGAVICLTNIVEQYPTHKWTIVSPVEETRMVWSNGYHYELIDFLLDQENWTQYKTLTLPTQYVFIYVEKRVLRYSSVQKANEPLPTNLQTPSEELAAKQLVEYSSKSMSYQDKDRAILQSKIYYWAQQYEKLFPDEFEVYYEDNDFICYKIEQNEYHLNNFAIDYGFNVKGGKK